MNIKQAAARTRDAVGIPSEQDPLKGATKEHAVWMLSGIVLGYIQHEKAHRWLGYAQALLVAHSVLSLDQCKQMNLGASKE